MSTEGAGSRREINAPANSGLRSVADRLDAVEQILEQGDQRIHAPRQGRGRIRVAVRHGRPDVGGLPHARLPLADAEPTKYWFVRGTGSLVELAAAVRNHEQSSACSQMGAMRAQTTLPWPVAEGRTPAGHVQRSGV
ncbi:hypothetical protein Acsp04_36490 [Actinomadura sp. NBRC 104425]|nr:hypothetical protein Acsp04_36490 [Actinomadura sp. NBRC 104425]